MWVLRLLLVSALFQPSESDVFSSMAMMESLLSWERALLREVKTYMQTEEGKLTKMKKFVSKLEQSIGKVSTLGDVKRHLGNPVNSYLMLKRMNKDWRKMESMVDKDYAEVLTRGIEYLKPIMPTQVDQTGAMDAIFRLQQTYHLKSDSLAQGVIDGVPGHWKHVLNMDDILTLGKHAYQKRIWSLAVQWLQTALDVYYSDDYKGKSINTTDVMDDLARSYDLVGDVKKAHELTLELARRLPDDERIANNLNIYQEKISLQKKAKKISVEGEVGQKSSEKNTKGGLTAYAKELRLYEKLCRGETRQLTKREKSKLKCWYRSKNPLLRLKPQKVERLWVNPEIFLFHDMMSDKQTKWIIDMAYPDLQRATIKDPQTGKMVNVHYRVSKSAWLDPYDHSETMKMLSRAEAVTGLDMGYAEKLQVGNYGMGGHYEPHFDHTRDNETPFRTGMGNRIATLLFYLSDVTAGGATVFTEAGTAVYPVKNAAVFWFNLKRNGKGNDMTKHAACPVLVGQKWVSNWWIHEHGQEFRRPCARTRNW